MGSDTDVARQAPLFHLVERFHHPFLLDDRQVFGTSEAVDVEQIHLVGAHALQTLVGAAQNVVGRAGLCLRCQEEPLSAALDRLSYPAFTLAVAVALRGVEVGDSGFDGHVENFNALVFLFVHQQAAAAAQCQHRYELAGAAENTGWQACLDAGVGGAGSCG